MDKLWPYLGDLHKVLPAHIAGVVLVLTSVACGMMAGAERQSKQKPAGARTLTLISVGSTIFTLASILIAGQYGDHTRIAAQVVTGVGFLGAGAIIRYRGTIVGLTTGATIWTAAAIGVLVGGGYAAAGLVLTALVVAMLTLVQWGERVLLGQCEFSQCTLVYEPDNGKGRVRALRVLDEFRIPDSDWQARPEGPNEAMEVRYCHLHPGHRAILFEFASLPGLVEIRSERAPRQIAADEPKRLLS